MEWRIYRNYGKDYPRQLLVAAAQITGDELIDREIPVMPYDITSLAVWNALMAVCNWLNERDRERKFPFYLFHQFTEYSPEMVAGFLLRITVFMVNCETAKEERINVENFKKSRQCCLYYEIVVSAFLDFLAGGSFQKGVQERIKKMNKPLLRPSFIRVC